MYLLKLTTEDLTLKILFVSFMASWSVFMYFLAITTKHMHAIKGKQIRNY